MIHRQFRSKTDGLRAATGVRDHKTGIYFRSRAEFERFCELRLLQGQGLIRNLKCHTRHRLEVNGTLVTTYEDDFQYDKRVEKITGTTEGGERLAFWTHVIEDVKPPDFMTDVARLKIALFNAIYGAHGLTITTTERRTRR